MTPIQAVEKLKQWAMWSCTELAKLNHAKPGYVRQIKPQYPDPPREIRPGSDVDMMIVDAAIARLEPVPKKTIQRHFRYQRIYSQAIVDYAVKRFIDVYLDSCTQATKGVILAMCVAPMIIDAKY